MRIAHVVEATFAGVGRHVLDLAGEQARRGHEVHVFYSPARESSFFATERQQQTAVTWHPMQLARGAALRDITAVRRIRRAVRSLGLDVVHGHSTKGGMVARMVGGGTVVLYTPNAVYSMNPHLRPVVRRAVSLIEVALSKRTDGIIAVSPEEQQHIVEIGIDPQKVRLVPNGIADWVETDEQSLRDELGLEADVKIVGFVGRLDHQKAPDVLVSVYAEVALLDDKAHFVVVGGGPLEDEVAERVSSIPELRRRCHLTGERPGRWALASFDVFVLPSRYEGFPYVLIEAVHAGLPVVTTTGACASQLIICEAMGAVHDPDDVTGMATSVAHFMQRDRRDEDELVRQQAGRFTVETMTDGVMVVIDELRRSS